MQVNSQTLNEWLNSDIFRCCFKMGSDGDAMTSGGKLLQTQAAVTPKMWYIGGMFHSNTEAEQSHCQVSRGHMAVV